MPVMLTIGELALEMRLAADPSDVPAEYMGILSRALDAATGRLQSQVACPKRRAIVCSGRKAQVLARSGMDIPEVNHPSKRKPNARCSN